MLGKPNGAVGIYFSGLSDVSRTQTLPGGRTIRFIRIDSDADIRSYGVSRLMARGAFQSQLTKAARLLDEIADDENEIRVLLIHHSYHCQGMKLSINAASRQAFEHFLSDYRIALIMTGHLHKPLLHSFVPPTPESSPVLEARCGTTTQVDRVPYHWTTVTGQLAKRKFPKNVLLVHRLFEDTRGQVFWNVEILERTRLGFKPAQKLKRKEIKVLPCHRG